MKGRTARIIFILAALFALFIALGPRIDLRTDTPPVSIPESIAELDAFLEAGEQRYPDLIPDTEKKIIWNNGVRAKTPLSVIYIHGFSATRQETAPLADIVASELSANLYYTRLKGHGRPADILVQATVRDWVYDMKEAYEIGKLIGDRIIIIGMSTGGTLAAWFAAEEGGDETEALVLISPNFGPKDKSAELLAWPWAKYYIPLVAGPEYSFEPINEKHALYWTERYPVQALFPMMGLIRLARKADLERIDIPVQVLYSPLDKVLDTRRIETAFAEIGSDNKEIIQVMEGDYDEMHIFAGDAISPSTTRDIAERILAFLY